MVDSSRWRVRGLTMALVLANLVVIPASASAKTCQGSGGQPRAGVGDAEATGVAVVSPCVAWFVGDISDASGRHPLIERWNGTAWKSQPAPSPSDNSFLSAVAATSATNAWVVGTSVAPGGTRSHSLIERWNGTRWVVQPSQNPTNRTSLSGVAAVSDTNAWAVGTSSGRTFIEHWNGTAWKASPTPDPPGGSSQTLDAVYAFSATNTWAVGDTEVSALASDDPLTLHWNGRTWVTKTAPAIGLIDGLLGVAATSVTNAWAVGYEDLAGTGDHVQLILHWNGRAWKVQKSPSPGFSSQLDGVVALSPFNAWAVGWQKAMRTSPQLTLLEHWNGTSWKVVSSPNPRPIRDELFAVGADSPNDVWAVGTYSNGSSLRPLAFHRG